MKLDISKILESKKTRTAMLVLTTVTACLLAVNAYYSIRINRKILKDESQS